MSSSPSGMTVSNHQCQRLNFTINLGNLIEQSFERAFFFFKEIFETLARVLNDNLYKLGCIHGKRDYCENYWDSGILR